MSQAQCNQIKDEAVLSHLSEEFGQVVERIHPDADERQRFAEAHIPVGYFGEPEDVGHLMAFLASPLARLITGSVLYVDGGMKRFSH